jgi:hypothetical protein
MDFLGTPATSTPSERVNSVAGQEFTTARHILSKPCACLRLWMKARVINLPNICQLVEHTRQLNHDASPGVVSTNTAISIVETVSMKLYRKLG